MKQLLLIMFLLLYVSCSANAADITEPLFEDGISRCAVVIADENDSSGFIAKELAYYLEKVGGQIVPVVSESEIKEGVYTIHVRSMLPSMKFVDVGFDGYVTNITKNAAYLYGRGWRGKANAGYGFLTDYLDIHWYMPGKLWEVVPQQQTIRLPIGKKVYKPGFPVRNFTDIRRKVNGLWTMRNRAQFPGGFDIPYFPIVGHNLANIISVDEFGKEHPEYFREAGSKRIVPKDTWDFLCRSQPCLTNPDVINITVDKIRETFDNNGKAGKHSTFNYPDYFTFSLSPNDNNKFCECSRCKKLYEGKKMMNGRQSHSDYVFSFVNAVAREVAKSHPNKTVGCLAYHSWIELPGFPLEGNVVIALTQDSSQYFDKKYQQTDIDIQKQWLSAANHVIRYTYWGLSWFPPRYYPHIIVEDIKQNYTLGIEGIYSEAYPIWGIAGPQYYLAATMLWNPKLDADSTLNEFFSDCFGPAAPHIKNYFDCCEEIWTRPRPGKWFEGLGKMEYQAKTYPREGIPALREYLNQAAIDAKTDKQKKRVEFFRLGFDLWTGILDIYDQRTAYTKNPSETDKQRLLQTLAQVRALKQLIKSDDLQAPFTGDSDHYWKRLNAWLDEVEQSAR
jgi:uncharacterized protein DUF4838